MFQYSDQELIDGLRERKSSCINYLYKKFHPIVQHYVQHNSGNRQDSEDLFNDMLIALYQQMKVKPIILHCSLKTYLMAVAKYLWLQRLERKHKVMYQAECTVNEVDSDYFTGLTSLDEMNLERNRLFYKNLMLLSVECKHLLQLYCLNIPFKEIARMLNYKDEVYVKTRKYKCKENLRRKIVNDPECRKCIEYNGN